MEAKAFLLNSKSILECVKEEETFEHVLEINKIMNTIIKKYDFPCALLCKYQDEYNKHIFTQIKRCNLSEVKNKINDFYSTNGFDLYLDYDGYLNFMIYGENYIYKEKLVTKTLAIKILPYDEKNNFIDLSDFILRKGKPKESRQQFN